MSFEQTALVISLIALPSINDSVHVLPMSLIKMSGYYYVSPTHGRSVIAFSSEDDLREERGYIFNCMVTKLFHIFKFYLAINSIHSSALNKSLIEHVHFILKTKRFMFIYC